MSQLIFILLGLTILTVVILNNSSSKKNSLDIKKIEKEITSYLKSNYSVSKTDIDDFLYGTDGVIDTLKMKSDEDILIFINDPSLAIKPIGNNLTDKVIDFIKKLFDKIYNEVIASIRPQ